MSKALTFDWQIIGHPKVLEALEDDMNGGNISHAYLFAGPENVGKFTAAMKMALFLQCRNGACGNCPACREIEKRYHADTIILEDDGESVKIEQVRQVLEKLHMSRQSPHKILLLQNIERMTLESSNALLKTLEDPPEGVLFLLTASRVKEVIPTILSRVRMAKFHRLSDESLFALLQQRYPDAEKKVLETACALSLGRPGKALSLLADHELYERYCSMHADVERFFKTPDRAEQFLYVEELAAAAKDEGGQRLIREFLDIFQLVLRKELLMEAQGERGMFSREKILSLLVKAREAQGLLKRNVNTRLLLENIMLSV